MFPCSKCDSTEGFTINGFLAAGCNVFYGMPCIACIELEKLAARIRDAMLLLEQLAERERALKSERNRYHDSLVRRLPLEIMSRIFTFRFRLENSNASSTHQKVAQVPLNLGAVCRTWQAIARSTPQLWTFIPVKLDDNNALLHAQFTREWLCRSGQLALSLRIYQESNYQARFPHRSAEHLEKTFSPTLNFVNEHSNRWKDLDVIIPKSLLARLHGNSSDKSILKSLSISLRKDKSGSEAVFQMKNLRPSPTKVTIHRMALKSIHVRWDHVIHVEIHDLCIDESLELLRQAQQMTHCSIYAVKPSGGTFPYPTIPIVHHFLRSLEFESKAPSDPFYDCVSLPALQNLIYHSNSQAPFVTLNALITRSSCRLTDLSIESTNLPVQDEELISILSRSPSLEDLSISGNTHLIPNLLFDELTVPEVPLSAEEDIFLPHLQSLRLSGVRQFRWSRIPQIFPEGPIVNTQHRPLSTFEYVLFPHEDDDYDDDGNDDSDNVDEETVQRLIAIIGNGVSINIIDHCNRNLLFPKPVQFQVAPMRSG